MNCARTRITYVNSALAEFVIFIFFLLVPHVRSLLGSRLARSEFPSREISERFLAGDPSLPINYQYLTKFLRFDHFENSLDRPVIHHLVYIQHSRPPMRFPSSIIVHPFNKIAYLGKRDMYIFGFLSIPLIPLRFDQILFPSRAL